MDLRTAITEGTAIAAVCALLTGLIALGSVLWFRMKRRSDAHSDDRQG